MSHAELLSTLSNTESLWRSQPVAAPGAAKVVDICQIWGDAVLSTKAFKPEQRVTVGASGCDFQVGSNGGVHTLIAPHAGVPTLLVPAGCAGFAELGSQRLEFEDMVASGMARKSVSGLEIPMVEQLQVAIELHGMAFVVRWAAAGKKATPKLVVDYPFAALLSGFLMLGGVIAGAGYALTYEARTEASPDDDHYVELMMHRPEPEAAKPAPKAKAKGPEGAAGPKKTERAARGNTLSKREQDRATVDDAGLNAAFQDEAFAHLGDSGLPGELAGGIPGLIGNRSGKPGEGGLGKGNRGPGFGGPGAAEKFGGDVTGVGCAPGQACAASSGGEWGKKESGGLAKPSGEPILIGNMDRSVIDEVIKRHMSRIRYCYQRELTKDPSLAGKIVMKFTIAGDGSVSSANVKATSMNNLAVEDCILRTFMKMEFPKPKGNGSVFVSYPFMFTAG